MLVDRKWKDKCSKDGTYLCKTKEESNSSRVMKSLIKHFIHGFFTFLTSGAVCFLTAGYLEIQEGEVKVISQI